MKDKMNHSAEVNNLAIVILHHNTPSDVEDNLNKLSEVELPDKTEVVVVNNGGNNANDLISKKEYKNLNLRFYDIPNMGFPSGNNYGISQTNATYIAMLNPDIQVQRNTITKLLNYLKNNKQVGIVAPQLIYKNGKIQDNYRVFPRFSDLIIKRISFLRNLLKNRMRKYLMWDKDPAKNESVDWVTGAFQIITRQCWGDIGPNCEDYFLFMSDVELCRCAWEKGYEVHFVGDAVAKHNETRLSEGSLVDIFKKKTMRIHFKDSLKYFIKFFWRKIPSNSPSLNKAFKKTKNR